MIKLKQKDKDYLEILQKEYDESILYINEKINFMKEWIPCVDTHKHLLTSTRIENEIHKVEGTEKNNITLSFISSVLRYLKKEYGLSKIDEYKDGRYISENYIKYDYTEYEGKFDFLKYADIIKNVVNYFKIDDFNYAGIEDLKNRIKKDMEYNFKNDRIKIINKKIKITDFAFAIRDSWSGEISFLDSTTRRYKQWMSGLNYIKNNAPICPESFKKWLNKFNWNNKENEKMTSSKFYNEHTINLFGIESFRFYKNGSLDIKFNDNKNRDIFVNMLKGDF